MNGEQNSPVHAPLPFLEAVAAHNLRVFADSLKTAPLDRVVVLAPGPDADGVPGPVLVDCMTEAGRRASPETWLPDVAGLVAPFQDGQDGRWRAGAAPPMPFANAAEAVAGALLECFWQQAPDTVGRAAISADRAALGLSDPNTGLVYRHVVEVARQTPQAGLGEILDIPEADERQMLDEAAFRHNLAVAVSAMQEAGIEEVVLRSGVSDG